jgi:hypothetical protein
LADAVFMPVTLSVADMQLSRTRELAQPGSRATAKQLRLVKLSNRTISSQGGARLETLRRLQWAKEAGGGVALAALSAVSVKASRPKTQWQALAMREK